MSEQNDIAAILQDYVPRADYEAALQAIEDTVTERDTHRTAAEQHTGRLAELERKLRGRTWKDAYSKLADELKIDARFRDDVYDLARFEPDADEPDERAMRKTLEEFLGKRKQYVAEEPREIPAGEGATRGHSARPGEPRLAVTRAQRNNALWMRDNQPRIVAAQKAGLLDYED